MKSVSSFSLFAFLVGAAFLCSSCAAFGVANSNTHKPLAKTGELSRKTFFSSAAKAMGAAVLVAAPGAALADEDYVKGSKNDPAVQAKLSVCMYECTKPKGNEQKSRSECLKECKAECITAKATAQ